MLSKLGDGGEVFEVTFCAVRKASQTRAPNTQLFRDVFKASPIGIVVKDLIRQPLFVNPAFCSMLGFSEEELRTKHCVDFSPPEDAEKDFALLQQLRAGSIDHYQSRKALFSARWFLAVGALDHLIVEQSSISTRPRDVGGHHRQTTKAFMSAHAALATVMADVFSYARRRADVRLGRKSARR